MEELIEEKVTTIDKPVTKSIANEYDKLTTRIEVYDINKADGALTCRLFDADGKMIAHKRVYEIADAPCDIITDKEMEILFPVLVKIVPVEKSEALAITK